MGNLEEEQMLGENDPKANAMAASSSEEGVRPAAEAARPGAGTESKPKAPSAVDLRRMESTRDQALARADKAEQALATLEEKVAHLELDAELARTYGGDENAAAAARELATAKVAQTRAERELRERTSAVANRELEVMAATFIQQGVPIEAFEGVESQRAVEAAGYRWLYENKKPAEAIEEERSKKIGEDYESGSATRRGGKSIVDMTPDEVADMTDKQLKPGFMKSLAGQPR